MKCTITCEPSFNYKVGDYSVIFIINKIIINNLTMETELQNYWLITDFFFKVMEDSLKVVNEHILNI